MAWRTVDGDLVWVRQVDGDAVGHRQDVAVQEADGVGPAVLAALLHGVCHLPARRGLVYRASKATMGAASCAFELPCCGSLSAANAADSPGSDTRQDSSSKTQVTCQHNPRCRGQPRKDYLVERTRRWSGRRTPALRRR